jgi:hypothetical protein
MPVRPERKSLYGDGWREFSLYIRFERAGGRCECKGDCGDSKCTGLTEGRCTAEHGKPHPVNGKRTILTTAHKNHDETSRDEDEVAALCARCHLFYDKDHHAKNRRETLEARRAADRARIKQKTGVIAFQTECATGRKVGR